MQALNLQRLDEEFDIAFELSGVSATSCRWSRSPGMRRLGRRPETRGPSINIGALAPRSLFARDRSPSVAGHLKFEVIRLGRRLPKRTRTRKSPNSKHLRLALSPR